jgi:hypothetical protein
MLQAGYPPHYVESVLDEVREEVERGTECRITAQARFPGDDSSIAIREGRSNVTHQLHVVWNLAHYALAKEGGGTPVVTKQSTEHRKMLKADRAVRVQAVFWLSESGASFRYRVELFLEDDLCTVLEGEGVLLPPR